MMKQFFQAPGVQVYLGKRVRHIPAGLRTYCGRLTASVVCIDLRRDSIEDAECKACQRSDDRRVREYHRTEQLLAGVSD